MNAGVSSTLRPSAARRMQDALAAQRRGDFAAAAPLYAALTRSHPDFPDAWHYYGLLMHQRGEGKRALALLERARRLDPDNAVFLLNLGRVLLELGQPLRAIECFERIRRLDPDHPGALAQLTQALLATERGGEIVSDLERRLGKSTGNDWWLWMQLGECREQGGDREGALAAFAEAALAAPAGEPYPHLRRAESARRNGDSEAARAEFNAALATAPASAEARLGLANLAAEVGDFTGSERLAREVLAHDPDHYGAWAMLAATHKAIPGDGLAEELEAAARRAGDDPNAWPLHFARGRVWEKLGDYERAFSAYAKANESRGKMLIYSSQTQVDYTRDVIARLDGAFVSRAAQVGLEDPGAIFVCGMWRSGTTLVETILAGHPKVSPGGEMHHIHDQILKNLGTAGMVRTGAWLSGATDAFLRELGEGWRLALRDKAAGRPRVTDKMPGNYALLGLIHVCFPQARIVHVRRDPRDNCFACYAMELGNHFAFSCTLEGMGHYYRLYERLMEHWRQVLPPGRIIEVEYERLVSDPETQIRGLLEKVGLAWDPRCLDFHKDRRRISTASLYQVRQPIYTTSLGRWRHFERHLGPLLTVLDGPAPL